MDVETFTKELAGELKVLGFKKQRLNWRKDLGSSVAVLNVQISPWDDQTYYINLGIYLKVLGNELNPTENRCHVQQRLDHGSPAEVARAACIWFDQRASISSLAKLIERVDIRKQGLVFHQVMSAVEAHQKSQAIGSNQPRSEE